MAATLSIERAHIITRIAFASTYPPRQCGIATFTHALSSAAGGREVVALLPPERVGPAPIEVHHRIRRDERADYAAAARAVSGCADVVSIQHGPGAWGGVDGAYVVDFAEALTIPAVVTFHAVPRTPTPRQCAIVAQLVAEVAATIVMSRSAASTLANAYGVDPGRIEIIPHGAPDLPLVDPATIKPALELEGRAIVLGFGLLRPDKGYELVIDALPAVVAMHPAARFVIVGSTHPDHLQREGEAYREALMARVRERGMVDHVQFVDRFVGRVELTRWLEAADVFVTPYRDPDQDASGTLSYAMGAGRAVVSTPYAVAAEMLDAGRGILVPFGSPDHLAEAVGRVLGDDELRADIGRRAYEHTRQMTWTQVGVAYRRLLTGVATGVPIAALRSALTATAT